MTKKTFPLEKILNVTATEYCSSVCRELKDYELVGVHAIVDNDDLPRGEGPFRGNILISRFQEKVPSGAEVVVSFNYALSGAMAGGPIFGFDQFLNQYASGTALIPKK